MDWAFILVAGINLVLVYLVLGIGYALRVDKYRRERGMHALSRDDFILCAALWPLVILVNYLER